MHTVVRGSLIGGGVGLALALVRRPKEGERDNTVARVTKSVAEGAAAGAVVGFVLDRRLRAQATALLAENAPAVVDAGCGLARRYEPAVEGAVDRLRDVAVDAFGAARPFVSDLAEVARGRAGDAYGAARPLVEDAYGVVRARLTA
ncbi:MAG: hypothetical protein QOH68_4256 [Nocardioidaceae bacterium]|nr:hypothetical protein [Nocardioidaceae bacterium]